MDEHDTATEKKPAASSNSGCLIEAIGLMLSMAMSYISNGSIIWAVIHAICGWIYVIYWVVFRSDFYAWLESIAR